jgi:hypothetical protein
VDLQHVNIKLYLEAFPDDLGVLIPVFHEWIRNQSSEELLIDVADYRHVFAGPGVVLIGHEGNYSLDNSDGRPGVRYNRKAVLEGTNQDRFRQATSAALIACQRLESDQALNGRFRFNRRDIGLSVNDRLLAPNTPETYTVLKPELDVFFDRLFGGEGHSVEHNPEPRHLFSVQATSSRPFGPDQLLRNISS